MVQILCACHCSARTHVHVPSLLAQALRQQEEVTVKRQDQWELTPKSGM